MNQLLANLESAAVALPFEMGVSTDPLDEDDLPTVIVERQDVGSITTAPDQIQGGAESTVFLAFEKSIRWDDIELVTGALIKEYKIRAPASDVTRIQYGRGASDVRLVELRIDTGYFIALETLPTDFRFRY